MSKQRYSPESINESVRQMCTAFRQITKCRYETAKYAAHVAWLAGEFSRMQRDGLRRSRDQFGPDPARSLERQLRRFLAKQRPQASALDIEGPAEYYLTQALLKRNDYNVYLRWQARQDIPTRQGRVQLVRDCATAANDAIEALRRQKTKPGRKRDHATHTFICSVADILRACLAVKTSPHPGTRFRRLLAIAAKHCDFHASDIVDPQVRSKTVEKALTTLPKFSGVRMAKRVSY